MSHAINSQNVHNILDHLSGLTSQKDFELLTFSLLKSIIGLFPKVRVQTISVSQDNRLVRLFKYTNDDLDVTVDDITLDSRVKDALLKVHKSSLNEYHEKFEKQSLAIFMLTEDRIITNYLLIALPRPFTQSDSYLITGVLEIYRNFSSLLIHAQTDELTGLSNRKAFETAIGRVYESQRIGQVNPELEKRCSSQDRNERYWMCAIDIDHFKDVNDNYGHLFGDEVLIRLAQVMRTEFRLDDLLFRFGGEEFIALIEAADRDTAESALERFRRTVETTLFSKIGSITVSIGIVEIDPNIFHMTLMDYADQALYYSKQNGRNRITFFEDLRDKGLARLETFEEGSVDLF